MKSHIIFTGGTIASSRRSDGSLAPSLDALKDLTENGNFTWSSPFNILSENMTPHRWNQLIIHLRSLNMNEIKALFITHGTDTLAYTSNLLSLLLRGLPIPVFMIASNLPFHAEGANGPANLNAAIALLKKPVPPGVYVPWKEPSLMKTDNHLSVKWDPGADTRDVTFFKGNKLLQSGDFSDTFKAIRDSNINDLNRLVAHARRELLKAGAARPHFPAGRGTDAPLINFTPSLIANILAIRPFPGIRYEAFDLTEVSAVLHGTYHSYTAPDADEPGRMSLKTFAAKAKKFGVPVYLAPISSTGSLNYASTKRIIDSGAVIPLYDVSFEMAFAILTVLFSKFELDIQMKAVEPKT